MEYPLIYIPEQGKSIINTRLIYIGHTRTRKEFIISNAPQINLNQYPIQTPGCQVYSYVIVFMYKHRSNCTTPSPEIPNSRVRE